jgi:GTPase SAR1 family protein
MYLRDNPKIKIKLCVIGNHYSGKTSLINAYLKYQNDALQKFMTLSENVSELVFEQNSEISERVQTKSHNSYTSSMSNVTNLIKSKLRDIQRFKTGSVSER